MKIATTSLTDEEIQEIKKTHGEYVKVTADLENKTLVIGISLHVDAENILLEKGGNQDNFWGGGVNLSTKMIDATAVYNIRPRLGNNNMEILDPQTRKEFLEFVRYIFKTLYD